MVSARMIFWSAPHPDSRGTAMRFVTTGRDSMAETTRKGGDSFARDAVGAALCSEEDLRACFRLLLGRDASAREWAWHAWRIGQEVTPVVRAFLDSSEFKARKLGICSTEVPELAALDGFRLFARRDDLSIGRVILAREQYEPHVGRFFRRLLRTGDHVLDIGANIGYFSMLAASLVGPGGKVVAVEPNPDNIRMLCASRIVNAASCLEILPFAAAERCQLLFYDAQGSNGAVGHAPKDADMIWRSTPVAGLPLDTCVDAGFCPRLIKIDVEGAEHLALSGALSLLRRSQPVIVSEFSPPMLEAVSRVSGETYLGFLLKNPAYHLWVLAEEGPLFPCGRATEKVMDSYVSHGTDHIDVVAAVPADVGE